MESVLRRSQRVVKPVERYHPEPTVFIDDGETGEEETEDETSSSEDEPTPEDLAFVDTRSTKQILAEAPEGSETSEEAEESEEEEEEEEELDLTDEEEETEEETAPQ